MEIVANTDASGFSGTEIEVGYGTGDAKILNAGRYRGVYIVQSAP